MPCGQSSTCNVLLAKMANVFLTAATSDTLEADVTVHDEDANGQRGQDKQVAASLSGFMTSQKPTGNLRSGSSQRIDEVLNAGAGIFQHTENGKVSSQQDRVLLESSNRELHIKEPLAEKKHDDEGCGNSNRQHLPVRKEDGQEADHGRELFDRSWNDVADAMTTEDVPWSFADEKHSITKQRPDLEFGTSKKSSDNLGRGGKKGGKKNGDDDDDDGGKKGGKKAGDYDEDDVAGGKKGGKKGGDDDGKDRPFKKCNASLPDLQRFCIDFAGCDDNIETTEHALHDCFDACAGFNFLTFTDYGKFEGRYVNLK
ncbi:MAG: hypothetical protein SGARI_001566 [Bacillariaceae sp.]